MTTIKPKTQVSFTLTLELDESAARALEAMAGYGTDEFLAVFYRNLGKHYMAPHEAGLRSLLGTISKSLPAQLQAVDKSRKLIREALESA